MSTCLKLGIPYGWQKANFDTKVSKLVDSTNAFMNSLISSWEDSISVFLWHENLTNAEFSYKTGLINIFVSSFV